MKYANALSIPEGKVGEYEIRHVIKPPGTTLHTSSGRTALLGGDGDEGITYRKQTRWHELSGPTGVWMTDFPIEQAQIGRILEKLRSGTVLVGGLGIGFAAQLLARRKRVRKVVVIEKSPEVIELVQPHLLSGDSESRSKVTVVRDDLFEYLKSTTERFDLAFYDIWQSDSESTFWRMVVPLIGLSEGVVRSRPVCWNENVMRGQLMLGLHGRWGFIEGQKKMPSWKGMYSLERLCAYDESIWVNWSVPFFRWARKESEDGTKPIPEDRLTEMIATYVSLVGRAAFWDVWPIVSEDHEPIPKSIFEFDQKRVPE